MKRHYVIIALALLMLCSCATRKDGQPVKTDISQATDKNERYILTHYTVAVEHMKEYRIPASITLAQGLLESGAGTSKLATEGKNHFGIKADDSWKGKSMEVMDNGKMCKFRVYRDVSESYKDHSEFLVGKSRYRKLFELEPDDYRGWAKGLKKAGYAEDGKYPEKLIGLIERYNLQAYDRMGFEGRWVVYKLNKVPYIIAEEGDRIETIAKALGISKSRLKDYNDIYGEVAIKEGDIIFLKQKKGKAAKGHDFHTAEAGESLHSISQMYGVRLKDIFRMNPQYKNYTTMKVGDIIRLR
jgi:LysM repeat protein